MKSLLDLFVISYDDPFNLWENVKDEVKNLNKFEIVLNRNIKLENLNNNNVINFFSENLEKVNSNRLIQCVYVNSNSIQYIHNNNNSNNKDKDNNNNNNNKDNNNKKDNNNNNQDNKDNNKDNRDNREERKEVLIYSGNTSEYPYLSVLFLPCIGLKEYKRLIKPKLSAFLESVGRSRMNVDFLVVVVNLRGNANLEMYNKLKFKLLKKNLRNHLFLLELVERREGAEASEYALENGPQFQKKLASLMNISVNKRYLAILISLNKRFLSSGLSGTVVEYENLSNLFQKLRMYLNAVIVYEAVISEVFRKKGGLCEVDFAKYALVTNPIYSVTNFNLFAYADSVNASQESLNHVHYRIYVISKQLLLFVSNFVQHGFEVGPLFLAVLLVFNFVKDLYFSIGDGRNAGVVKAVNGAGERDNRRNWFLVILVQLIHYVENQLQSSLEPQESNVDNSEEDEETAPQSVLKGKKKKLNRFRALFRHGRLRGARNVEAVNNIELFLKSAFNINFVSHNNIYKYVSFLYLLLYKYTNITNHHFSNNCNNCGNYSSNKGSNNNNNNNNDRNNNNNNDKLLNKTIKENKLVNKGIKENKLASRGKSALRGGGKGEQGDNRLFNAEDEREFGQFVNAIYQKCLLLSFNSSHNPHSNNNNNYSSNIDNNSSNNNEYDGNNNKEDDSGKGIKGDNNNNNNISNNNSNKNNYCSNNNNNNNTKNNKDNGRVGVGEREEHEEGLVREGLEKMLSRMSEFNVSIINKCIKYFLLGNLYNCSNVFESFYLRGLKVLEIKPKPEVAEKPKVAPNSQNFSNFNFFQCHLTPCREYEHLYNNNYASNFTLFNSNNNNSNFSNCNNTSSNFSNINHNNNSSTNISNNSNNSSCNNNKVINNTNVGNKVNNNNNYYKNNIKDSKEINGSGEVGEEGVTLYKNCLNYVHLTILNLKEDFFQDSLFLRVESDNAELTVDHREIKVINVDNKVLHSPPFSSNNSNISANNISANSSTNYVSNNGTTTINNGNNNNSNNGNNNNSNTTNNNNNKNINGDNNNSNTNNNNNKNINEDNNGEEEEEEGWFRLGRFRSKLILCVLVRSGGNRNELRVSEGELSGTSGIVRNSLKATILSGRSCLLSSRAFPVVLSDVFGVELSESAGHKFIHLDVLYEHFVKIHKIYLNGNIICGNTLLDHGSVYKIKYSHPPNNNNNNNRDSYNNNSNIKNDSDKNNNNRGDKKELGGREGGKLEIWYSLYRKHKLELRRLNVDGQAELCFKLLINGGNGTCKEGERERRIVVHDKAIDYAVNMPSFGYVHAKLDVRIHLVSREDVNVHYQVRADENWFVEGIVVNRNLFLEKGKACNLFFRLIPLRFGQLLLPSVLFQDVSLFLPSNYITIFPNNNILI